MFQESLPTRTPSKGYDPIILTDSYIECSEVVERFLDLIYPGSHHKLSQALLYRDVIRLARKWQSLPALESLYNAIHVALLDGHANTPPIHLFVIAVGLEDSTLLKRVVVNSTPLRWDHRWNELDYVCEGISNGSSRDHGYPGIFDCGAWPLDHYLSVPPTVIWCLLRARDSDPATNWTEVDLEAVGDQFEGLLRYRCECNFQNIVNTWFLLTSLDERGKPGNVPRNLSRFMLQRDRRWPLEVNFAYPFVETWITDADVEVKDCSTSQKGSINPSLTDVSVHDYNDADVTLISSDDVMFKAHTSTLGRAS